MDEDNLGNSTTEYGELFEGETAVFGESYEEDGGVHPGLGGIENGGGGVTNIQSSSSSLVTTTTTAADTKPYQMIPSATRQTSSGGLTQPKLPPQKQSNQSTGRRNLMKSEALVKVKVEPCEDMDVTSLSSATSVNAEGYIAFVEDDNPKEKLVVRKNAEFMAKMKLNKHFGMKGYPEHLLPKIVEKEDLPKMTNPEMPMINTVSFGVKYKPDEMVEELERFLKLFLWMKERNSKIAEELKPMLMPIFVHLVRECFIHGLKTVSTKLVEEYSTKILQEHKTQENCLIALAIRMNNSSCGTGFEENYLKEVCQKCHKFTISQSTFNVLKNFLAKNKKGMIMNILSNNFNVEVQTPKDTEDPTSTTDPKVENIPLRGNTSRIQRVLSRLRGSISANLPSIKLCTTNGRPVCAAMSKGATRCAFGMSPCGIRICTDAGFSTAESDEVDNIMESDRVIRRAAGHEGIVYGLAFHPKTELLFSVGQDSAMRVWDIRNQKRNETSVPCRAVYRGHSGAVWSIDMSPSGRYIATAGMDTTSRLWVPERVDCVRIFAGHYLDVDVVKFHPNESYVATGSLDKSVRFWSVTDGEMVRVMTGANGKVRALAFHKSGKYLVGGGADKMVNVWDLRDGEMIAQLPCPENCRDLSFCGNMLAGCFGGSVVQVWNLRNIVGGEDAHFKNDFDRFTVPEPYAVECDADSLISVYYQDVGNLYCMGAAPHTSSTYEPPTPLGLFSDNNSESHSAVKVIKSLKPDDIIMSLSGTTKQPTPEYVDEIVAVTSQSEMDVSTSAPPAPVIDTSCSEAMESESLNNTITSSDMELFEVDEQTLQSFVDDAILPS